METEFATDDIKNVFSKIMKFMEDSDESVERRNSIHDEIPVINISKISITPEKKEPIKKIVRKVSASKFNITTLARMQARQNAVDEKLKSYTKLAEDKINENIKQKPEINKNYKNLQIKPISQRYEDILEMKKRKISDLSEKINKERTENIEKELTFRPNLGRNTEEGVRDFDEILERMKEWEDKKNTRALLTKERLVDKLKGELTFKPHLCRNSVRITEQFGGQKDVALRLFELKKAPVEYEHFTFVPTVLQHSTKLARTRSETQVFSRLYAPQKDVGPMGSPSATNLIQETE